MQRESVFVGWWVAALVACGGSDSNVAALGTEGDAVPGGEAGTSSVMSEVANPPSTAGAGDAPVDEGRSDEGAPSNVDVGMLEGTTPDAETTAPAGTEPEPPPASETPETPASETPAPETPETDPPSDTPRARCVGITDPNFDLDVERPRGDPAPRDAASPALFIVGDSTVKNHNVQQEGWGDLLGGCFDAARFQVINWAREGRSTRSFIEEGLWAKVLAQVLPGDFVMVQFGHNDQSTLDTRGTIPGTGEDVQSVVNSTSGVASDVHTYGYYLRQYARDARAASAHLIFVTPVPRNYWTSETLMNNTVMAGYVGWMQEVALSEQLPSIDLNAAIVDLYTSMGKTAVSAYFTSGDNTHTNVLGATESAQAVLAGVQALSDPTLAGFLLPLF
ncbi:MAG TPA: GDSL-type esterase/lipase family protein [Polyangiaceae bacterium]|nr:GDSL-type esterase/lipase family protein [Polyangiaceae bacterium]